MKNVLSIPFMLGLAICLAVILAMFTTQSRAADFAVDQSAVSIDQVPIIEVGCPCDGGSCTITRERSVLKSITIAPLNDTTPACTPACEKATDTIKHPVLRTAKKALRVPMKILKVGRRAVGIALPPYRRQ